MKVLWIIRKSLPYNHIYGEFMRAFEEVIGKDNVVFYGKRDLPKVDIDGEEYYPSTYKILEDIDSSYEEGSCCALKITNMEKPDVIVVDGTYIDVKEVNVPRVAFMNDTHSEWSNRKMRAKFGALDMLIPRNWGFGISNRIRSEMGCIVGYSPAWVSTKIFNDEKLPDRKYNVYVAGCISMFYPLRVVASTYFKSLNDPKYLVHEGDVSARNFATRFNQSKITITDTGCFRGSILKFFEIPACKSLLMSNLPMDYKALHIIPNENMVEISTKNFKEKVAFYLEHEDECKKIINNGYNSVMKYHTVEERTKQLLAQLEELVNCKNEGRPYEYQNVKGEAGEQIKILLENEKIPSSNVLLNDSIDRGWAVSHLPVNKLWEKYLSKQISLEQYVQFFGEGW